MFVKKFECQWIFRKNLRTYGIIEKLKLDFSYTNLFVTIITTISVNCNSFNLQIRSTSNEV